ADIHVVELVDLRFCQCVQRCFDEEIAEGLLPQLSPLLQPYADDCHITHLFNPQFVKIAVRASVIPAKAGIQLPPTTHSSRFSAGTWRRCRSRRNTSSHREA